jgi:hypothetical protein
MVQRCSPGVDMDRSRRRFVGEAAARADRNHPSVGELSRYLG